jgi:uncharacterized protein
MNASAGIAKQSVADTVRAERDAGGSAMQRLRNMLGALCVLASAAALAAPACAQATSAPAPSPAPTPAFESADYHFKSGGVDLVGRLFVPRDLTSYPLVVLVQGADYDDANASVYWRLIAHSFAKAGIASFSFNKRGVAGSDGKATDNFDVQAADVAAACAFASHLPGVDARNVGYYGMSQAGWIVPRAVRMCPSAFTILVSSAGVTPAQSDDYYLAGQFLAVGMTAAQSHAAIELHDALARYYRTGDGYERAQALVSRAAANGLLQKFRKVEFRDDVPASNQLPPPGRLAAIDRSDPSKYEFYRDPRTWSEPTELYASLVSPLLLVYGGRDDNVPVEQSIAIFQRALRANSNRDVTIHIFESANHDIQIGPRVLPGYREYMADWIRLHLTPH